MAIDKLQKEGVCIEYKTNELQHEILLKMLIPYDKILYIHVCKNYVEFKGKSKNERAVKTRIYKNGDVKEWQI